MKRYEVQEKVTRQHVLVEEKCDGCGRTRAELGYYGLIPVVIEINLDEEGGGRDELDYCDACLIERAAAFVAAGSRAEIVTGEPREVEDNDDA